MLNQTTVRQEIQAEREEYAKEKSRENRGFVQVYPQGWERMRVMMQKNPQAARLFTFIAENIDGTGAVVATRKTLAEAMGVSEKSITRYSAALVKMGALVVLRVGPGANAYALHPEDVWTSWDDQKPYAVFYTKTLVRKADNKTVKRKITHLLNGKKPQPELPLE